MKQCSGQGVAVHDEELADDVDLGPDDRDADLMDGRWEDRYYSGQVRQRDWKNIYLAVGLLIVMALVVPLVTAALR